MEAKRQKVSAFSHVMDEAGKYTFTLTEESTPCIGTVVDDKMIVSNADTKELADAMAKFAVQLPGIKQVEFVTKKRNKMRSSLLDAALHVKWNIVITLDGVALQLPLHPWYIRVSPTDYILLFTDENRGVVVDAAFKDVIGKFYHDPYPTNLQRVKSPGSFHSQRGLYVSGDKMLANFDASRYMGNISIDNMSHEMDNEAALKTLLEHATRVLATIPGMQDINFSADGFKLEWVSEFATVVDWTRKTKDTSSEFHICPPIEL